MPSTTRAAGARRAFLLLTVLSVLLGAGCGVKGGEPEVPQVEPEPTVEPEPEPEPAPPPAEPIAVRIVHVDYESLSNAVLVGRDPDPPNDEVLHGAVEGARQALERYLNAQFVDPETRFSHTAIQGLLTGPAWAAYEAAPQPGLGQLVLAVTSVTTAPVDATAVVSMEGGDLLSVLLQFDALFEVTLADGRTEPLEQRGAMLFVPTQDGWRVDAVDLGLDAPADVPTEAPTEPPAEQEGQG